LPTNRVSERINQTGLKQLDTYGVFTYDIFLIAILNRCVNLNRGFTNLMRDHNFIAAAPLVRVNLDSLLRIYASELSGMNVDQFAQLVIDGTPIRSIKTTDGKKMFDNLLVERISLTDRFKWVKQLYDAGNSFVHLTNKHVFASTKVDGDLVKGGIQATDDFIHMSEKTGACNWMLMVNKGIIHFIQKWIDHKGQY
jgi:hypothetical protein